MAENGFSVAKGTGNPIVLAQHSIAVSDCSGNGPSPELTRPPTTPLDSHPPSVTLHRTYTKRNKERVRLPGRRIQFHNEGFPLRVLLAFQSYNGSRVIDLNVNGAAYAVYDSATSNLCRIILISPAAIGSPSPFRSPWAAARLPSYTEPLRYPTGRSDLEEQPGRSTHGEVGVPKPRLCGQLRCTSFWIRCHGCRIQQTLACERVKWRLPGSDSGSPGNTGNGTGSGGGSNGMPSLVISTSHSLR